MKTELKDVLHLYRGCEIQCEGSFYKLKAVMIDGEDSDEGQELWVIAENDHHGEGSFFIEDSKPVLRPLSDMTEMEMIKLLSIVYGKIFNHSPDIKEDWFGSEGDESVGLKCIDRLDNSEIGFSIEVDKGVQFSVGGRYLNVNQFEMTNELLKRHFDLFGLIENGFAIDKTTLKP